MVAVKYMGSYDYQPSIPGAIVFAALFGILSLVHMLQLVRHRTWFFIPFVVGGILEVVGYGARAFSSHQYPDYKTVPVIIQAVFILVGPSLFAASVYMELGRIMLVTGGEKYSLIRRSWLTKIFVVGDAVAFLVQSGGAAMLARAKSAKNGEKIVKIGLIVQVLFFALFIVVSILFHIRITRHGARFEHAVNWRKHQLTLYAASMLIFVRCIFRFVEYQTGSGGALMKQEYWTFIFDAAFMVLAMLVFNLVHPGEIGEALRERGLRSKGRADPEHDDEAAFLPQAGPIPMAHVHDPVPGGYGGYVEPGYAPPTFAPADVDTHYAGAYAQPARDHDTHYPGGYSRYEGA
ncbi:hypothetical protein N7492_007684 [Penicillium capsulatum]|uniref:RTA1-domain-containing protein n=1 Tax=Penicillium capsulatum TaxID=69766 RepID=A0A9W9I0A9_9EURO|nr:hypothetical protein N7492_007684 [Penicillium capsulatum]KAJ6117518.1 hypothetical protein N7512_007243 [Penicillium capsulatum]